MNKIQTDSKILSTVLQTRASCLLPTLNSINQNRSVRLSKTPLVNEKIRILEFFFS